MKKYMPIGIVIEIFCMYFCMASMIDATQKSVPYIFAGIIGFVCLYINYKDNKADYLFPGKKNVIWYLFACIFGILTSFANYDLFEASPLLKLIYRLAYFLGSVFIVFNVIICVNSNINKLRWFDESDLKTNSKYRWFIGYTLISSVFYISILVLCKYPGTVCWDTLSQLDQIYSGEYNNVHPFYMTILMKLMVDIGVKIFGNINIGILLYAIIQILLLSAVIGYALMTLYSLGLKKVYLLIVAALCLVSPVNIKYSITILKDVPFAIFGLLFIVALYRYLNNIDCKWLNIILLNIGGVGFCLFRLNGYYAYVPMILVSVVLYRKQFKKMLVILMPFLIATFMKYALVGMLGASQADSMAHFSLELQQIARVVVSDDGISDENKDIISKVISIDKLKELYDPNTSDPIVFYIREDQAKVDYINSHMDEYRGLYFDLAKTHMKDYVESWVDSTSGYWNAAHYNDGWYKGGVVENPYGIEAKTFVSKYEYIVDLYCHIFAKASAMQIFINIGFMVWIISFVLIPISIHQKDSASFLVNIPSVLVALSLCASAPLNAEFRYMYIVFLTILFSVIVTIRGKKENC